MTIEKVKTEFDILIEKYMELKNDKANIEKELEAMKKDIVSRMNGQEEVITDFHKVTNKEQIKDGVDLAKLKKEFTEAYNACFKPSIFPVLRTK